jgi:MFS family permease
VPFLALWLTGPVGMSPVGAGITGFGVYSLTAIAGGLFGGVLSDRVGRRPVMLVGLAAGTLRLALLAFTTDPVLVTALIAFGGFVDSVVGPASSALVADRVSSGRLNEAFGTVRAARTLALGLGPVLGAALAPVSFAAVLAAAACCRAIACLAALGVREPRRRARRAPRPSAHALRDQAFLAVLAGTMVMALFYGWYDTVVPVHLEDRGLSVATWGAIYAGGAIFMASLAIQVARLIDRRPRYVTWIAGGAAAYAAGFVLLLPGEIVTVIPGVALIMVAQMILNPLESTLAALLAPPGRTGAYQGALSVVYAIAFATGPVFGLGLYDATSAGLTFLAVRPIRVGCA